MGTRVACDLKDELSRLIDLLNERLGTDFKPADQRFFDSIRQRAVADSERRQVALVNTMESSGLVFFRALEEVFIDRMEQNEGITARFLNEPDFRQVVGQYLLKDVYEQIMAREQ